MGDEEDYTRDILLELNNEVTEEVKVTTDKYTKGLETCLAPGPDAHTDLEKLEARIEKLEKEVAEIIRGLVKEV